MLENSRRGGDELRHGQRYRQPGGLSLPLGGHRLVLEEQAECDGDDLLLFVSDDRDLDFRFRLESSHGFRESAGAFDELAVEGDDAVAGLQARLIRRGAGHELGNQHAVFVGVFEYDAEEADAVRRLEYDFDSLCLDRLGDECRGRDQHDGDGLNHCTNLHW